MYFRVQEKKKVPEDSIVIVGLPGIGYIGKLIVDYFIDKFRAQKIVSIYSSSLLPVAIVEGSLIVGLPSFEIYKARKRINKRYPLLLFKVDIPVDLTENLFLISHILSLFNRYKIREIVFIASYLKGAVSEQQEQISCCSNINKTQVAIHDISGIIAKISCFYNLKAEILSVSSFSTMPGGFDLQGVRGVIYYINNLFDLGIKNIEKDLERLREEIEKSPFGDIQRFQQSMERVYLAEPSYIE